MPSILIAGGGLVGSVNACLFAQKGWSVRVFESRPDPRGKEQETGKSINLALGHRAMETLERVGKELKERVIAVGVPVEKQKLCMEDGEGRVEKLPVLNKGDFVLTVGRKKLSDILISEAEKYRNVKYHFGWKAVRFDMNTGKLIVESPEGEISLDGDLIVACDGALSMIYENLLKVDRFVHQEPCMVYGRIELSTNLRKRCDLEEGVHLMWAKNRFIITALVNKDATLTVSLFGEYEKFENLYDSKAAIRFFKKTFPVMLDILGEKHISESFTRNNTRKIIGFEFSQHAFIGKLLLMSNAAHVAYGKIPSIEKGVNYGFENCLVLQKMLERHGTLVKSVEEYSKARKKDRKAINEMEWKAHEQLENVVYIRNRPISSTMPSILIAGGGLVGSVNACLFAQKGWSVRVFESRSDPRGEEQETVKSINLGYRAMETLERVGKELKERVIAVGVPVEKQQLCMEDGEGRVEKLPVLNKGDFVLTVGRKKLSDILISEAEKYRNVKYHFGWKAVRFDMNTKKLIVESPEGEISLDGDLILACDGAHSSIRRSLLNVPRFSFQQQYIGFGYMDLSMNLSSKCDLELGVHNTWIKNGFIIVALVNRDDTLTVSLFAKFEEFEKNLYDPEAAVRFFKNTFPVLLDILGEKHIYESFDRNKPQAIISVRCSQHAFFDKLLLMGDAAHAMVPFSGQGVNCGFEDCLVLQEMLEEHGNLVESVREYSEIRTEDTNAMNEMAWKAHQQLENFGLQWESKDRVAPLP